jgi:hypothetical protein
MLSFQYINDTKTYNVSFEKLDKNHVKILGDIPVRTNGFILGRIGEPKAFTGDYSEYKTVYREIDGGVIFSNDGSEYVEPVPIVNFYTNGGGTLDGAIMQEVSAYEDLIVPTPIPNENYEFTDWSPEIPLSGKITGDTSFNAIFTSTLPQPDPEPTVEERVTALEEQNSVLEECLLEISEVVYA